MTKVKFFKIKDKLTGFEFDGHTGYAEMGKDIVCAAVSTASQMALLCLTDEIKIKPEVKLLDGYLKVVVKEKDLDKSGVQLILKTCLDTIKSIEKDYKKNIKLEVKENV